MILTQEQKERLINKLVKYLRDSSKTLKEDNCLYNYIQVSIFKITKDILEIIKEV